MRDFVTANNLQKQQDEDDNDDDDKVEHLRRVRGRVWSVR